LNHIDALKNITSKTGLIRSLRIYYQQHQLANIVKYNVFDSIATSYIIEIGNEGDEYWSFIQRYKELSQNIHSRESMPAKHCKHNLWLIKPANLNQGKGITLIRNLNDFKRCLHSKLQHSFWVVQKYIEKPMLYNGRKFDIRIWVLVLDTGDLFLYKNGYIRTSSEKFTLDSKVNFVHLTNNCLQMHGSNYGKHEEGNTLSFNTFKTYLSKLHPKVDFDSHIVPRMKDLIIDTIMSVKSGIIAPSKKRGCTFELLGYDFMIDEDLRVWLIEVNTNPYLGMPNEYIKNLLPCMIKEMLYIALDSIYPTNNKPIDNNFELLYCEFNSRFSNIPINKRRSFNKELIYPLKELERVNVKRHHTPHNINNSKAEINVNSLDIKRHLIKPLIPPVRTLSIANESLRKNTNNEVIDKQRIAIRKRSIVSISLEELVNNLIKWKDYAGFAILLDRILIILKRPINSYLLKDALNVSLDNLLGIEYNPKLSYSSDAHNRPL